MEHVQFDPDARLGDLVASNPEYARVFESLDIDYCCGGATSLATACEEADLALERVAERLDGADGAPDREHEWDSPTQLANVIVWDHHRPLRRNLPDLEALVEKVADVHGDSHPELQEVESEFQDLVDDMFHHIDDEEQNAFPVIKKLDTGADLTADERARIEDEIDHLEAEHSETADRLERINDLTDGYAVPEDACASYRRMLERLENLERDTHMHVHRENNVLFPKAADLLAER
ncbi:iron-sulfur cluster repair di-iron protein [Halopiger xanaduensis]|uniref:Iron-sulfur cluster repair di-iron protein n=1 Tax=Halopiger xanaduensis (strain DSM 18323 / JCM 14033 / SH-6) TaxID=797210 RepID=F8D6H5_HALXS|nr:iron-sulfur cluster repair di-iron protein [Halopiger xanaduensis]AEH36562.1 iron-sulfur cluster repair di-iron protein [Halopiger xanaduensis SH-6]